ncbi:MFS transporter [Caldinitratiruptor microaerophilus]|uniref:MFS transporter n=2 Tax=Caldinitratiruptor microaerophilus TaxID=671077 RepID=A0AA35CPP9_9FIRM|nr:MFS transporter [Caldinitratiruptor microaerophilus]
MQSTREGPALGGSATARRAQAMRFVVLLGIVSLFADMTYEGARSATGPFLLSLGASASVVGVVAGLGEFLGYAIRLASGYLTDRLRQYWLLTALGYVTNLLAVPLLALAGRWEVAAGLVLLERMGKAVRTPSRDVMLSFATRAVGRGLGFGLHELLDQIGAVVGPLLVASVLFAGEGYRRGFAVLLIPALLALATLAAAWVQFPAPEAFEGPGEQRGPVPDGSPSDRGGNRTEPKLEGPGAATLPRLGRDFWLYVFFASTAVLGFAHFQLISFHLKARGLLPDPVIPLAFAVAMAVDALAAVVAGKLYDRLGVGALFALPLGIVPATVLAFGSSAVAAWAGVVVWGAVLGVQETIMRAAVADLAPPAVRGRAYGLFNTAFGVAWFVGSAAMGFLYNRSTALVILFSVLAQAVAVPLLLLLQRELTARHRRV